MSKRVIITGATGLIGKKLVELLVKRNDEVVIFSRNAQKAKSIIPNATDYVEWNYNKPETWKNYLENSDVVIHLSWSKSIRKKME